MYKEYPKFYNHETLEYDRKSRFDDKSLSVEEVLARHAQILKEYAENYLGGEIPDKNKYQEVGSGEQIDERPEMLRLLKAIENPAIKAILVVDVQRLSRGDLEDAGRLIKLLRYSNTYVITPYKIYDLRDEYDRDAFERELKKGNEYLEYFKKIQRQGKLASVKAGNYVGSVAPFGFYRVPIKDGNKDCFKLAEKKDEADVVRMIFHWYCNDDIGATAICRRLESMNVKTKNKKDRWKPSLEYIKVSLNKCISDFEMLVDSEQDDSDKLHKNLVAGLEKRLNDLAEQEILQWKAQTSPDPTQRMPNEIFQTLNGQLLKEKEEVKEALCKAKDSIPVKIDYKEKIVKFTDALNALEDPEIPAKIKNRYLRDILERIDYDRGSNVRITKSNAAKYNMTTGKGMKIYSPPYNIKLTLKS